MSLNNEMPSLGETKQKEAGYVAVTVFDDMADAKDCQKLLQDNDISVYLLEDYECEGGGSVAVMVLEDSLDEAQVVIESQDAYDDYYELASDEELTNFDDMFDDEY